MRTVEDITNFIFVEDKPEKADIIFIPGSSNYMLAETAAKLYHEGFADKIMPSGKYFYQIGRFLNEKIKEERYKGNYATECEFLSEVLIKNGVADTDILREENATNTYENSYFSKKLTERAGISVKRAIICPQAFHARRALMTYSHAFPDTEFFVIPSNTQGIDRNNWNKSEKSIKIVLSELRKCGEYFEEYFISMTDKQGIPTGE